MKINAPFVVPQSQTSNLAPVNPWYIIGFTDGECPEDFQLAKIQRVKADTIFVQNLLSVFIVMIYALLERIAAHFGVGSISIGSKNLIRFQVSSISDLVNVIIPLFECAV